VWIIVLLKERTHQLPACTWADPLTPEMTEGVKGAVVVTATGEIEVMVTVEEDEEMTTAEEDVHRVLPTDEEAEATVQEGGIVIKSDGGNVFFFFSFDISFGINENRLRGSNLTVPKRIVIQNPSCIFCS